MKTQTLRRSPALVLAICLLSPGCSETGTDAEQAGAKTPAPVPQERAAAEEAPAEPVADAPAPEQAAYEEAPPVEAPPAEPATHEAVDYAAYGDRMPTEGEGLEPADDERELTAIELYGYAIQYWAKDFHRRAQELDEQLKNELPKPGDLRYHERLAMLLYDREAPRHADAIQALLEVEPASVRNKATRAKIARGFRDLATDPNATANQEAAITGLVLWGGKFSAPLLLKMLEEPNSQSEAAILKGLGQVATPEAAEALVKRLESGTNREQASESLIQMGPVAEAPLVAILPAETAEVNLAAINVLGEIGTKKCTALLRRASQSENEEVAEAAREAMRKVQSRERDQASRGTSTAASAAKANQ